MDVINNSVTKTKTEFSELIQYVPTRVSMNESYISNIIKLRKSFIINAINQILVVLSKLLLAVGTNQPVPGQRTIPSKIFLLVIIGMHMITFKQV